MKLLYQAISDTDLASKINSAIQSVWLTIPGVNMDIAVALESAVERLDGNVHLLIDASDQSFARGYNDPQAVLRLQECIRKHHIESFRCEDGIRTGVLVVDGEIQYFSPQKILLETLKESFYNSAFHDETKECEPIGKTNLSEIRVPAKERIEELRVPKTKEEQLQVEILELNNIKEKLEKRVEELKKNEKLPIQKKLQFVEIEIADYQFDKRKINIPKAFMTDTDEVNSRLASKYSVIEKDDIENANIVIQGKTIDYSLSDFLKETNSFRNAYTFIAGKKSRMIRTSQKKAFELECKFLMDAAELVKNNLECLLHNKTEKRLNVLCKTLEEQVKKEYVKTSDYTHSLMDFFTEEIMKVNKKIENTFNPKIFHSYKDISREDAESNEFRKGIEKALGPIATEELFSEIKNDTSINSFLANDEIVLELDIKGERVFVIENRYSFFRDPNPIGVSRGIQRFWARIIDFLPDDEKTNLERFLNMKIKEEGGNTEVSLSDYSYLDVIVWGKADTGSFGKAIKAYMEDILLCRPMAVSETTSDDPILSNPQQYATEMISCLESPFCYKRG